MRERKPTPPTGCRFPAAIVLACLTALDTRVHAQSPYVDEFLIQYDKIKNPASGYFSPEGIPYHSIETLLVEAPDHGHETTSEAFSFWLWLEAQFGRVTGDWAPFNQAWTTMETSIIPDAAAQPGGSSSYNPSDPADYAREFPQPSQYPTALDTAVIAGSDPLAGELEAAYGNRLIYGMHWLLDVDDIYGYGTGRDRTPECGDTTKRVTYINTYQRGPQESVWETVAHPSCETGRFGQAGVGFPPLFIAGSGPNQWRYTDAPDADARAVQAAYWALVWATQQGNQAQISATVAKAAKLGDFLRYSFHDKYFKNPGCTSTSCTPGSGKSSSSYLLTWYYAWGGDIGGAWAWRIGSSAWHQGYQNPLAAWALSSGGPTALRPLSPSAGADWQTSLDRQLDSYLWLQSAEGAIAGGATNSWNGNYEAPPPGTPTFYGWAYDFQPVFHDPPSNRWFGFQVWSLERVAEYLLVTADPKARTILDRWVPWALSHTTSGPGTSSSIPSDLEWSGAPAASYSGSPQGPGPNPDLHVRVITSTSDVGVAAAYARTLTYYAKATGDAAARTAAKNLIDGILAHKDAVGVSVAEVRRDYNRFDDPNDDATGTGLFIPAGFTGRMPNGDLVQSGRTFLDIRSFYRSDPAWPAVQAYLDGGPAPSFNYHRFWAQADIAMAAADFGMLFPPDGTGGETQAPTVPTVGPSRSEEDAAAGGGGCQAAANAGGGMPAAEFLAVLAALAWAAWPRGARCKQRSRRALAALGFFGLLAMVGCAVESDEKLVSSEPPALAASGGGVTVDVVATSSWQGGLNATATDDVGVTWVDFLDGSSPVGSDTSSPFTVLVDLSALDNGDRSYAAVARDAAGNTATSAPVAVTVNIAGGGGQGPGFSTAGGRFFRNGSEVVLFGLNWFGLETSNRVLHGLWTGRQLSAFLADIKSKGFNALRLPLSPQAIESGFPISGGPGVGEDFIALDGKDGRAALEYTLGKAQAAGLFVLLDFHTCDPARLGAGLPGSPINCTGYSLEDWLSDLRSLAALSLTYSNVIGVDLTNEPHALTWAAWADLASQGGRAVLEVNPNITIWVEGVGNASANGGFSANWGGNLVEAAAIPGIPADRLVFSPHSYGPSVAAQSYFSAPDYPDNMPGIWDTLFGHLLAQGFTVIVGEFGGHYTTSAQPSSDDKLWQDTFVSYLLARGTTSFFYWAVNPNSGDTGGVYLDDWTTWNEAKLALLRRLID